MSLEVWGGPRVTAGGSPDPNSTPKNPAYRLPTSFSYLFLPSLVPSQPGAEAALHSVCYGFRVASANVGRVPNDPEALPGPNL